tara:strand:- start:368 stop:691 length:324 start_codon:yes stop_codon:yes gene_type:complete
MQGSALVLHARAIRSSAAMMDVAIVVGRVPMVRSVLMLGFVNQNVPATASSAVMMDVALFVEFAATEPSAKTTNALMMTQERRVISLMLPMLPRAQTPRMPPIQPTG